MTRQRWKQLWRLIRISRREHEKAYLDAMFYGTGVVMLDADGAHHVPLHLHSSVIRRA